MAESAKGYWTMILMTIVAEIIWMTGSKRLINWYMRKKYYTRKVTMNNKYGDGSFHEVCEKCGFCIPCGDCQKYGCGNQKGQEFSNEESLERLDLLTKSKECDEIIKRAYD